MSTFSNRPIEPTVHFEPRRRKKKRRSAVMTVNLTPAIDITFNLLIFFLVATTFKAAEGILPSKVPVEQGVLQATPLPISPIKIRIEQIGNGPSDYRLTIDNWRRQPGTFLELTQVLEGLLGRPGFDNETPVVLIPQGNVQWDHVVNCFNAVRRVNFGKGREHLIQNITFAAGR